MNNEKKYYETFGGHKVSEYALKYGRLDYATMSKCFDCVLCNNVPEIDESIWDNIESGDFSNYYYLGEEISREEWEEISEDLEDQINNLMEQIEQAQESDQDTTELLIKLNELKDNQDTLEQSEQEIMQYFIVSDNALYLLKEANELVFYSEKLDCYIWGVCHWGTSWDYVLTGIKLEERKD